MKKPLVGMFIVLAVSSVACRGAHAATLLNSTLVCESDQDGVVGTSTDAKGKVVIMSNGTFKLTLSKLAPGVQAVCQLICVNNGIFGPMFSCGIANASGKISFTAKEAFDPTALCVHRSSRWPYQLEEPAAPDGARVLHRPRSGARVIMARVVLGRPRSVDDARHRLLLVGSRRAQAATPLIG